MDGKEQYERKYYKVPSNLIHEEDYLSETRAMKAEKKKRIIKKWCIIISFLVCILVVSIINEILIKKGCLR